MKEEIVKKYCELILKVGVNLYKGQCLAISCGTGNMDFGLKLSETAYELGAKFVELIAYSNRLKKSRVENNTDEKDLEYIPNFPVVRNFEMISSDWAYVRIDNLEEIDELKNINAEKFGIMSKKELEVNSPMSAAVSGSKIPWCIVAAPGPLWAAKVMNEKPSGNTTEKFTDMLIKVLRLDKSDPVTEWKSLGEKLISRSKVLTGMNLDKLIFTGPGTDLEIGLNKGSFWLGGPAKAANGRAFLPNIPTEEVFITPDFNRTNGKVKVTKPVKVLENSLTGIWFEFKDGKVIDFGSDDCRDILEKFLNTDEGARYLGEVALVDKSSGVHRSGHIFNSILYDENAACHIALGRGFPSCFPNKDELITPEELKKNGCNYSLVHTDFMIGSEVINVTGVTLDGKKVEIIKDGEFKI
jgi:aminopeptidase